MAKKQKDRPVKEKDTAVELSVKVTFGRELLGTAPLDPAIYQEYVSRGVLGEQEELETLPNKDEEEDEEEKEEKKPSQVTGFHRDDGHLVIYDYQVKGFLKEACATLKRTGYALSNELTAHKKCIDGLVFVEPRRIAIELADGATPDKLEVLSRSLRAQTAKGDRIAIASSEVAPAGSTIQFKVTSLSKEVIGRKLLEEWLNYGCLRGLCGWRNAGYGQFTWEEVSQG